MQPAALAAFWHVGRSPAAGSLTFAAASTAASRWSLPLPPPPSTSTTTTMPAISATPSRPPKASVRRLRRAARLAPPPARAPAAPCGGAPFPPACWTRADEASGFAQLGACARARARGARPPALVDEVGDLAGQPLGRERAARGSSSPRAGARWAAPRRACRRRRTGGPGRAGGRSPARASRSVRRSPRCGAMRPKNRPWSTAAPGAGSWRTVSTHEVEQPRQPRARAGAGLDEPHHRLAEASARPSAA